MKKTYTLITCLFLLGCASINAQDTLLYESFNFTYMAAGGTNYFVDGATAPPANVVDSLWYSFDADGLPDVSGGTGSFPAGWFQSYPFAYTDTTNNTVMAANSWISDGTNKTANNWLISPNVQLGDHDTLFWKSAPRQTPRYMDGYEVRISTTNNSDFAFYPVSGGDTLFTAAEMSALPANASDSLLFSAYTFSTPGFVFGEDGTHMETHSNFNAGKRGQLRNFSVPLDAYANKNVFIAFHHTSTDDYLISIDDVMIRGTASNPQAGIKENKNDFDLVLLPNPATDEARMNFTLTSATPVSITVCDIAGKLVYSDNKGEFARGRHFANINTSVLAKGFYTIAVKTTYGKSTAKLVVQ